MLNKSVKFGTALTVGPRLQRFIDRGIGGELLWDEDYPEQEDATHDGRGRFQRTREWIETASLEELFDLWCRGRNLPGFAELLIERVEQFKKILENPPHKKRKPGALKEDGNGD